MIQAKLHISVHKAREGTKLQLQQQLVKWQPSIFLIMLCQT